MKLDVLESIGFEKKEVAIYKTLLSLGPSPASKIGAELGMDRTTAYYIMLKMLEKGYISQVISHNSKTFSATSPEKILELLEERKNRFAEMIPSLQSLHTKGYSFTVEVRQGIEGIRYLYRDAVHKKNEVLGLGIDDAEYMDLDETGLQQYYRDAEAVNLKEKLITYKGAKVFGSRISEYRYVDKAFFQPTPTLIYGNTIVMIQWKPLYLIFIDSPELAESFRKHFKLLWKMAKPSRNLNFRV
ncbi:MAG: helix-turn-helix domain-containing protein [Candidatus Woesearchaeota archaeon]